MGEANSKVTMQPSLTTKESGRWPHLRAVSFAHVVGELRPAGLQLCRPASPSTKGHEKLRIGVVTARKIHSKELVARLFLTI